MDKSTATQDLFNTHNKDAYEDRINYLEEITKDKDDSYKEKVRKLRMQYLLLNSKIEQGMSELIKNHPKMKKDFNEGDIDKVAGIMNETCDLKSQWEIMYQDLIKSLI